MHDLNDHPFSAESIRRESSAFQSRREIAWLRWIDIAERTIGHDLDGNDVHQAGCGYSLDEALEHFNAGVTPGTYVTIVRTRKRYRVPS